MGFTIESIASEATVISGKPITGKYALRLINEAIIKLAAQFPSTATVPKQVPIVANDGNVFYNLPPECIGIKSVYINGIPYKYYLVDSGLIRFNNPGSFTVLYTSLPSPLEDLADVIPVHDLYKVALPFYVAGMSLIAEDSQDPKAQNILAGYSASVQQAHIHLSNQKTKDKRIPSRLWR